MVISASRPKRSVVRSQGQSMGRTRKKGSDLGVAGVRARPMGPLSAQRILRAILVTVLGVVSSADAAAQGTGSIRGRVTSAGVAPVLGVSVSVEGVEPVLTNDDGIFVLLAVPTGPHELTLEHVAYGRHSRSVFVETGVELALDVAISTQVIELSPLVVETLTDLSRRRISSGAAINEVTLPEISLAARSGLNLSQLLQNSLAGVDVRTGRLGEMCVTYRAIRSDNNRGDCDGVSVILDGVPIADPSYIYTSIPLSDIERVEMISPGQAGVRYGMRRGQSVLLIETKRAEAERVRDMSRLMTGFDWTGEQEPYPMWKVFGSTFLANAAGVGVGLALANRCFSTPESASLALRTQCRALATVGASILSVTLPAIGGSIAARLAGQTERSHSRVGPTAVTAGIVLTGGYLLLISGGDGSDVAGALLLSVGVPAFLTLADRVFRIQR